MTVWPVIGLSPSRAGAVQLTCAEDEAGFATTPVGGSGATAALGVTALDCADAAPEPFALTAWTVNRYAVPDVRPVTTLLVAVPSAVTGASAVVPS